MERDKIAEELVRLAKELVAKDDLRKLEDSFFKELRNVKKGLREGLSPLMKMIDIAEKVEKGDFEADEADMPRVQKFHSSKRLKEALKDIQSLDKDLM